MSPPGCTLCSIHSLLPYQTLTDSTHHAPGFEDAGSISSILAWTIQGSQEEGWKERTTVINVFL